MFVNTRIERENLIKKLKSVNRRAEALLKPPV
jgi:hypothetical protein